MTPATSHETTSLPGISSLITEVNKKLRQYAEKDSPVFITGEQGTEKAFAAKVLHLLSNRASQPLFKLSVSYKLPPDLAGRFLESNGGTLIINLQREFPVDMQYTLLEMMSDKAFADPLSGQIVEADVRLILTSSLGIEDLAGDHELLPEIVSALQAHYIEIPPIRDRPEDIPALVRYATNRALETGRTNARGANAQVLALFRKWDWPGNAEDLLLVTAEAALNATAESITLEDLPPEFLETVPGDYLEQARQVRLPDSGPAALRTPVPDSIPLSGSEDREPLKEPVSVPAPSFVLPSSVQTEEEAEKPLDDEARRLQRLIALARRLNTQSQMLARQMSGPLDRRLVNPESLLSASGDPQGELAEALEGEIDRGLDAILGLRRQLARLNQREKESLMTARDLYRRLLLSGQNLRNVMDEGELKEETAILAEGLREMDTIIQHVSGSFPKLKDEEEPNPDTVSQIQEEEARAIEETLRRAREREREREQERLRVLAEAKQKALESSLPTPVEEVEEEDENDSIVDEERFGEVTTAEEQEEAPASIATEDKAELELEDDDELFDDDDVESLFSDTDADETVSAPILDEAPEIPLPPRPEAKPVAEDEETHPPPRREDLEKTTLLRERHGVASDAEAVDDSEKTERFSAIGADISEEKTSSLAVDDFESVFDDAFGEEAADASDLPDTTKFRRRKEDEETHPDRRRQEDVEKTQPIRVAEKEDTQPLRSDAARPAEEEEDTVTTLGVEDVGDAFDAMFGEDDEQEETAPLNPEEEETLAADFQQLLDDAFGEDEGDKQQR